MPPLKKTACGMGAMSYWREYHMREAHCGRKVPVLVGVPARPEEIAQTDFTAPRSVMVRRWLARSSAHIDAAQASASSCGDICETGL